MTSATGITMANMNTARTRNAVRQPIESATPVMATGIIRPATDTPEEPRAMAQPRLTTNHFERVTLTTNCPTIENPTPPASIESRMNCHNASTRDMVRNEPA